MSPRGRTAQVPSEDWRGPGSWASSPGNRRSMVGNRSRDTTPELAVRSAVHRLGLRYRVASRPLPTLPRTADLVFRRVSVAVFVDGCFWHGCPEHHAPPATNAGYWTGKVRTNRARDLDTDARLADAGWVSIRLWEHDDPGEGAERIAAIVRARLMLYPAGSPSSMKSL
jgi:DNA mismatch endonuclease, patch repair protein